MGNQDNFANDLLSLGYDFYGPIDDENRVKSVVSRVTRPLTLHLRNA